MEEIKSIQPTFAFHLVLPLDEKPVLVIGPLSGNDYSLKQVEWSNEAVSLASALTTLSIPMFKATNTAGKGLVTLQSVLVHAII